MHNLLQVRVFSFFTALLPYLLLAFMLLLRSRMRKRNFPSLQRDLAWKIAGLGEMMAHDGTNTLFQIVSRTRSQTQNRALRKEWGTLASLRIPAARGVRTA
jgi:hypothetical protein